MSVSMKIYDMNMVQLNVNDTQIDLYQWVEAGTDISYKVNWFK